MQNLFRKTNLRSNKQMGTILLVASNFPPVRGGSASVYSNLVLNAEGAITVLAPYMDYTDGLPLIGWREHDMQNKAAIIRVPLIRAPLLRDPSFSKKLRSRLVEVTIRMRVIYQIINEISRNNVRVICVGELLSCSWILRLFKYIPFVKTIAYIHGEELTTQSSETKTQIKLRSALKAADKIIVVSQFTKEVAEALLQAEAQKTVLIPNGVDTKRFQSGSRDKDLVNKHALSGYFVFLSVCRLVEKKGIDKTIEAFSMIKDHLGSAKMLIVGAGPYYKALVELVELFGLADSVVFAGSVPERELIEYYKLGDVFVMPNRALPDGDTEGFGLVFLEANSCGLPVIAGRDGGSLEAVREGVNGLVVNGNSAVEIAAAMLRLRYDDALRRSLIQGGRMVADTSDWHSRTETFIKTALDA